jgi:hypothetical protein
MIEDLSGSLTLHGMFVISKRSSAECTAGIANEQTGIPKTNESTLLSGVSDRDCRQNQAHFLLPNL